MPREIVRDFRRNNTLLFIAGSPGWVTEEEVLSLCTRGSDNLGGGNCAETW